jgi:hypothetical protein
MRRHIRDWRLGFERAGKSLDDPVERSCLEGMGLAGPARGEGTAGR